tara:strand:- start:813 stop:956 length:144 start_codon:yes stop_codon:yes gene_type:complete
MYFFRKGILGARMNKERKIRTYPNGINGMNIRTNPKMAQSPPIMYLM